MFKEVTGTRMATLVKEFVQDNWVWGEGGIASVNPAALASDVIDLYERDYLAAWDSILDDIELVSFPTVPQTADALGILAGPTSPLRGLLRSVVENTALIELSETPPSGGLESAKSAIVDRFGRVVRSAQEAAGMSTRTPGALVTAHFQPVQRLMSGAPAPMIGFSRSSVRFSSSSRPWGRVSAQPIRSRRCPIPLFALHFRPCSRTLRRFLHSSAPWCRKLAAVPREVSCRVPRADFENRYQQQVLQDCNAFVAGRYPFVPASPMDVQLADFAACSEPAACSIRSSATTWPS